MESKGAPPRNGGLSISTTGNPLEQLQLLRDFVGAAYTERQLTDSLKKCYYNVERAAEMLLTGASSLPSSSSSSTASSSKSQANRAVRYRSDVSSGKKLATLRRNRLLGHAAQPDVKLGPVSASEKRPAPPRKPPPPPPPVTATTNPRKPAGGGGRLIDPPRPSSQPPETIVIDDDSDEVDAMIVKKASATTISASNDAVFTTPKPLQVPTTPAPSPDSFYVLCERWISDGVCTTRMGKVAYQEKLELSAMGDTCVRFRAEAIEGRVSDGISRFLAPLLLEDPTPIRLEGRALMELDRLGVGGEVPMALRVLVNPVLLFREEDADVRDADLDDEAKSRKKASLARASCVFRLVQWAEHGELLPFEPLPSKSAPATNISTSNADLASSLPSSSSSTSAAASASPTPTDDEANKELSEEDFEGDDTEGDEKDDAVSTTSEWARTLPEADEPKSWQGGVTLRPYQRQALHWMLEREHGTSREEWEKQLAMVASLSGVSAERAALGTQSEDISCECGPVLVSDKAKAASRTVSGDVNPIKHPLWKQRYLASPDFQSTLCFFVNECMQIATHLAPPPPAPCSGGILADSMGLGKTVMLLALILKSKELKEMEREGLDSGAEGTAVMNEPTATLVVAKLSLLPQWEEEIKTKTSLSCAVYYGPQASKVSFTGVDVVLTTYGTIQGERTRKNPQLLNHRFLRVVLDEAHCVKNHNTLASKVCCQLQARHRWCVSGTILQNSLDDVYGIMRFLRHEPWCHGSFWKKFVTKPMEQEEDGLRTSLDRVRRLLSPLMLRRTKSSLTNDGEPILALPPVETKVVQVELTDRERDFYNAMLARSMEVFDGFVKEGTAHKSYFQIFSLLQRLRQVCDHIALTVRTRMISNDVQQEDGAADAESTPHDAIGKKFLDDLLSRFCSPTSDRKRSETFEMMSSPKRQKENYLSQVANSVVEVVRSDASHMAEECPICLDHPMLEAAVLTPCAHVFCRPCLMGYLRKTSTETAKPANQNFPNGECPCCHKFIEGDRIIAVTRSKSGIQVVPASSQQGGHATAVSGGALARQILREALQMESSSKMTAIFKELDGVWREDPGSKVLIFSHYLGFLDLLEARLRRDGVPCFRLDGSLSLNKRASVLDDFRSCCTVATASYASMSSRGMTDQVNRGAVLLMSMSAGGEGLNLTAASTCFICEPWWNSAKEDQCVSRINRIGQKARKVRVSKFVVAESVEERIVELQQRKAYMADEIYSDEGRHEGPVAGGARLGLEDFRHLFQT